MNLSKNELRFKHNQFVVGSPESNQRNPDCNEIDRNEFRSEQINMWEFLATASLCFRINSHVGNCRTGIPLFALNKNTCRKPSHVHPIVEAFFMQFITGACKGEDCGEWSSELSIDPAEVSLIGTDGLGKCNSLIDDGKTTMTKRFCCKLCTGLADCPPLAMPKPGISVWFRRKKVALSYLRPWNTARGRSRLVQESHCFKYNRIIS